MTENLVSMARAAEKDERLSDGALYGKLAGEIERLQAALEDIISPLAAMKRRAALSGHVLSGMAYSISRDPNYLQGIAREALAQSASARESK